MFEKTARAWLLGRTGIQFSEDVLAELTSDLCELLEKVYESGCQEGYYEGLEDNLKELQW